MEVATRVILPLRVLGLLVFISTFGPAQEHRHPAPEKLGSVSFPISCKPAVQGEFNRGVALLHSFAYDAAVNAFRQVAEQDEACAMAHWGVAMSSFHQLWEPPLPSSTFATARGEVRRAKEIGTANKRERALIEALALIYQEDGPYQERVAQYEQAMCRIAADNRAEVEPQVFCALALLAHASPRDREHADQKAAAEILEPLFREYPDHPGIPHYLIHAYDNPELAGRGLIAARAYAQIAPAAPHALHMPSHIFTQLGLWEDSIASNRAAQAAARRAGDVGEELHAMDYLIYAYLQVGHDGEAAQVLEQLRGMPKLNMAEPKVGYAATAMPIRYAVERQKWAEASAIRDPAGAPPHVCAIAAWARGLGLARSGHAQPAAAEVAKLHEIENQLYSVGNEYWAIQTRVLGREVSAWAAQASQEPETAVKLLREAANEEDSVEKLPVTPGPIVPGHEQLGYLLLEQRQPCAAQQEFAKASLLAPGRRAIQMGTSQAAQLCQSR